MTKTQNNDNLANSMDDNAGASIVTYAGLAGTIGALLMVALLAVAGAPQEADAALVSQDVRTWTLKSEPTTVQLVGSGDHDDWHYLIMSQPTYGQIPVFDGATGEVLYQPKAGEVGKVDSFTYRLQKDNPNWFSSRSTVKVALVEDWTAYFPEKVTPTAMADYFIAKGMTAAKVNTTPNIDNIEPYKQTPHGKVAYANVKASWELSGQSWWSLSLGQKQWLMDNAYQKTLMWMGGP